MYRARNVHLEFVLVVVVRVLGSSDHRFLERAEPIVGKPRHVSGFLVLVPSELIVQALFGSGHQGRQRTYLLIHGGPSEVYHRSPGSRVVCQYSMLHTPKSPICQDL